LSVDRIKKLVLILSITIILYKIINENYSVQLENLNIYQQDEKVLKDVTICLKKGEFVYIIGRVGSGKSSLLKVIYGEIPVTEGEGNVCGFDLKKIKKSAIPKLRRKLGIVFQDFKLLTDRTVYQNLKFVLSATGCEKKEIDKRIIEVLDNVGMSDKIKRMPHELSGGEQQRIVIARALLNHPELILADEPTGNLDPETSEGILKLLADISNTGCSVIMATHNYSVLKKFPYRTIKCEENKISELNENITAIDFESIKE